MVDSEFDGLYSAPVWAYVHVQGLSTVRGFAMSMCSWPDNVSVISIRLLAERDCSLSNPSFHFPQIHFTRRSLHAR